MNSDVLIKEADWRNSASNRVRTVTSSDTGVGYGGDTVKPVKVGVSESTVPYRNLEFSELTHDHP